MVTSSTTWEKLRDEPARAHALFSAYLALGLGRSLPALAHTGAASVSYLKKLSTRWHWKERAIQWQAQMVQAGHPPASDQITEARARQLNDALAMQQLAKAQISQWLQRDREGTLRLFGRFTPHQTMRLWQTGFRIETALLPAPEFTPPPKVTTALSTQREKRRSARDSETSVLPLATAFAQLDTMLRTSGVKQPHRRELLTMLRTWLWLPPEEKTSIPALPASQKKARAPMTRRRKQVRDGR